MKAAAMFASQLFAAVLAIVLIRARPEAGVPVLVDFAMIVAGLFVAAVLGGTLVLQAGRASLNPPPDDPL